MYGGSGRSNSSSGSGIDNGRRGVATSTTGDGVGDSSSRRRRIAIIDGSVSSISSGRRGGSRGICMGGDDAEQPAPIGEVLEAHGDGRLLRQHPRQKQPVLALQVVGDCPQEVHIASTCKY